MSTTHADIGSDAAHSENHLPVAVAAWQALDDAHGTLSAALSSALRKHHNLSLNAHAVLQQLTRAPGHKLRMSEIATRIDFSLSGLTGLVGRLEQDGLIERQSSFADRRVIYARLTDAGVRQAQAADARHQETIETFLAERFEANELSQLAALLRRVTAADRAVP